MGNNSTGQFEGGKYLEAASSLSTAGIEDTGLLQHGSYQIARKHTTQDNSLVLEVNTKRRMLYHAQVNELLYGKLSYLYR